MEVSAVCQTVVANMLNDEEYLKSTILIKDDEYAQEAV